MTGVIRNIGYLWLLLGLGTPHGQAAPPSGVHERICDYAVAVINHAQVPVAFKARLLDAIEKIRADEECWGWLDSPEREELHVEVLLRDALRKQRVLIDPEHTSIPQLARALRQGSLTRLQEIEVEHGIVIQKDRIHGLGLGIRIRDRLTEGCLKRGDDEAQCRWILPTGTLESFYGSIGNWSVHELDQIAKSARIFGAGHVIDREIFAVAREIDPENPWLDLGSWCKRARTFWEYTPLATFGDQCEKDALRIRDLFDHERLHGLPARGGK